MPWTEPDEVFQLQILSAPFRLMKAHEPQIQE
jgi:hypothetical protein